MSSRRCRPSFGCSPSRPSRRRGRPRRELTSGLDRGPLHGIPVAVKDLFDTAGVPTEGGSRAYAGRLPEGGRGLLWRAFARPAPCSSARRTRTSSPTASRPLRRTTLVARARGRRLERRLGRGRRHGRVLDRARHRHGRLDPDPCRMLRRRRLKPTYGRVSRNGCDAARRPPSTLAGPLARSVRDLALALAVLAGHEPGDPSSADVPVDDYLGGLDGGVAGLTVGVAVRALLPPRPGRGRCRAGCGRHAGERGRRDPGRRAAARRARCRRRRSRSACPRPRPRTPPCCGSVPDAARRRRPHLTSRSARCGLPRVRPGALRVRYDDPPGVAKGVRGAGCGGSPRRYPQPRCAPTTTSSRCPTETRPSSPRT